MAERSPACLRHLGSCARTAKGGKMFGCFSWTKKGTHDLLWPKDKNQNQRKNYKNEIEEEGEKKKTRKGYASLGCSKHIDSEECVGEKYKRLSRTEGKPNERKKKKRLRKNGGRWMTGTERDGVGGRGGVDGWMQTHVGQEE